MHDFFEAGQGMKQGDPNFPIWFNLVDDVFTNVLSKAAANGLIRDLLPHLVPGSVTNIQYADDVYG
jgi:hypothetical protein